MMYLKLGSYVIPAQQDTIDFQSGILLLLHAEEKGLQILLIAFSLRHLRLSSFNALEDPGAIFSIGQGAGNR